MPDTIRILGIDPSTQATGRAILEVAGREETVGALGVYKPRGANLDEKLLDAYEWMQQVIEQLKPDVVAIETPFFKLNAQTMFTLASLGAAYRLAATRAGLRVIEVPPAKRCTAVGMPGNASKAQLLYTINAIYHLHLTDRNIGDSIAIAAAAALQIRTEDIQKGG